MPKLFGKTIEPVSRVAGIDVRWFYVWLDKIEAWFHRKEMNTRLSINSSRSATKSNLKEK